MASHLIDLNNNKFYLQNNYLLELLILPIYFHLIPKPLRAKQFLLKKHILKLPLTQAYLLLLSTPGRRFIFYLISNFIILKIKFSRYPSSLT
ncbi:MAG TPA: hypothetical protein [Caudoviricetes sp.]|nr:MAG TPA: hypothetical protein [Caudoviricetes sp.]